MADKKEEVVWMFCAQCKRTVLHNNCGLCLACQEKYDESTQPDSWVNMHKCKKCGEVVVFLEEGCLQCQEGGDDDGI